jgi:hypothetical protein
MINFHALHHVHYGSVMMVIVMVGSASFSLHTLHWLVLFSDESIGF